jgi:hypothetical protein
MKAFEYSPLQFFRYKSKIISVITLVAFLNLTVSCSYYRVRTLPNKPVSFESYKSIKKVEQRYVIIHSDSQLFHLSNIFLNEDKK